MKPKILVNLPSDFFTQPELAHSFSRLEAMGSVRRTSHNTAVEIADDLSWADTVFMWSWPLLDEPLLDRTGALGFAGHIDVSQAGARAELARAIPVSISRAGFSPAVAEMALGLILNALRGISDYHASMRNGTEKWVRAFPKDIDPRERELTGRTVGIIGFGQVGRRLAHFLRAFDVKLKVADPFVGSAVLDSFAAERVDIDRMIPECEIVVLCAASNDGTRHLIDAGRCASFRKDGIFINVARAALVDYAALADRTRQGDLIVCLDVFDTEPLPIESEWRRFPNAFLTPHRAGGLICSVQRNLDWLIDDFEFHLAGKPRRYPLTEGMIAALDR